ERDRVGHVQPAVGIDVEPRLGAGARADRVPAAHGAAAGIARDRPAHLLHDAVLLLHLAALGRELVDRPHRLVIGLVLLEALGGGVVLRPAGLQQTEVALAIDAAAAAVARHAGDHRRYLDLLAVAERRLARIIDQLAVLVVDADVAFV